MWENQQINDKYDAKIIKLYINLIPDINKYLILPESKPIELINDTTYPLIFSNKKSTDGKCAYVTTNSNMDKTTSGAAFKVKGSGVIIFDYFVSSEANANRYSTADSGDKLLYGINTVLEFGKVLSSDWESYGHVLPEYANLDELKAHYTRGGLGDVKIKKFLNNVMQEELAPIRARRAEFEKDIPAVYDILKKGSDVARETAAQTLSEVKRAMRINYFDDEELIRAQSEKYTK